MERKSARQSRAHQQRAAMGRAPKGMRPLGYTTAGDVIPHEAEAVRAIYAAFSRPDSPESLRSIARALSGTDRRPGIPVLPKHTATVSRERAAARSAQGLPPRPSAVDGVWSPSTVLGVLRNPRYAGKSTYTPKTVHADGARRRSWKAQILRDDAGEPVRGQWMAIVDDETWWQTQEILDDEARVSNTSGSTQRKHLGSGLFVCGVCGHRVQGATRGYRCAGHVMRTGSHIDDFVTEVLAARLARRDVVRLVRQPSDDPASSALSAEISSQRARIMRAQHDYDNEIIEGHDLKRIRDAAEQRIHELEVERVTMANGGGLVPLLGAAHPDQAFRDATLSVRRQVIDALCSITLLPQPRGQRGFDPSSVEIVWRS